MYKRQDEGLSQASLVVSAIPSSAVSSVANSLAMYIPPYAFLVSATKGFDYTSLKRPSQVWVEANPELRLRTCVLSGPNFAKEIAGRLPAATVVAGEDESARLTVQKQFMTPYFRVYSHDDVVGVEVGGALKNVIALACGMVEGMELGDNARAAIISRGLAEMVRLGAVSYTHLDVYKRQTVDSVDVRFNYQGKEIVLVDTAGLRRPARIDEKLEELAVGRALRSIKRSDVVLLLIDGTDRPSAQERRIAGYIRRNGKASILLVNKVDLGLWNDMSQEEYENLVLYECRPIAYSNVFFISCLTGKGMNMILPEILWTYEEYHKRIETSVLNQALAEIMDFYPPPRAGKIFYATQVEQAPPKIVFFVKDPSAIPESYIAYLEAEIRKRFGFRGVPINMEFRPRR